MSTIESLIKDSIGNLQELENHRLRKLRRVRINLVLFFVIPAIGIPVMIYYQDTNRAIFFTALILMMANFFRHIFDYIYIYHKYEKYFKEEIISKLTPALFPNLNYDLAFGDFFEKLNGSMLIFNQSAENYDFKISSHFYGEISGQEIEAYSFSTTEFISGIYYCAKMSKPVESPIYIGPRVSGLGKSAVSLISALPNASNLLPSLPEISLKLPEFENVFTVYSSDEETVLDVITPSKMETILNMEKEMDHRTLYTMSFVDDEVHIIMRTIHFATSVSLGKSILDPKAVEEVFALLMKHVTQIKSLTS